MTWWRRAAANLAAFLVGAAAAVLSWRHIVHTAKEYGHEPDWAAMLYPVPIDGMMIVGVVMAADDRATGRRVRGWARVATWVGGVLSILNQVASAYVYGGMAIAVAVIPSGSLIITVEVMSRRGKQLEEAKAQAKAQAEVSTSVPSPESIETPITVASEPIPQASPEVPTVAPQEEPDAEEQPETTAKPPRSPRRRRASMAGWSYPTPREVDVIEATVVETDSTRAVVPAFYGPAVVDPEADMG